MEPERLNFLFRKYVQQTASPAELTEFMNVIRQSEDQENLHQVMDEFWDESPEVNVDKRISASILRQAFLSDDKSRKLNKLRFYRRMGWAAIIAVLLGGVIFLNVRKGDQSLDVVDTDGGKAAAPVAEFMQTVYSRDEHKRVLLPDSSTVVLNNHSILRYPSRFGKRREVTLTGEGYFDIKHNPAKSFTVFTGKIQTTVLGTAFNIEAYPKDKEIKVTVARGKVRVNHNQNPLAVLTANQQVVFDKIGQKASLVGKASRDAIRWQADDIFFEDVTLQDAATVLEKRFRKTITIGNEQVKKCRFTATFLNGESLEEILKIICSFNNAQYQPKAGGITINGKGCEP